MVLPPSPLLKIFRKISGSELMVKRKIIEIDEEKCTGCGQCVIACAEGALEIIDGKAKVIKEMFCDGLGACIGDCPEDALKIIEREADNFDEDAVKEHLTEMSRVEGDQEAEKIVECGCPSAIARTIGRAHEEPSGTCEDKESPSCLGHWPIKIMLVNPRMPFLKGADLVVLADCVAVAYRGLHEKFLGDNVIMIGCPKFGDIQHYREKFEDIFKNSGIKSVSVAHMEVPCCNGLVVAVKDALAAAGNKVPAKRYQISVDGNLKEIEF